RSHATGPASPATAGHGSAATTSSASPASAAARAPQPVPPTRPAAHPATRVAQTTPAVLQRRVRAPARRSPPPPSAPQRLIRRPKTGPCRLNAYLLLLVIVVTQAPPSVALRCESGSSGWWLGPRGSGRAERPERRSRLSQRLAQAA